jgi:hypothetical protein
MTTAGTDRTDGARAAAAALRAVRCRTRRVHTARRADANGEEGFDMRWTLTIAGVALVLAACAGIRYGPNDLNVGDPEAAVVGSMGQPTDRYEMADGVTRLVYARGPAGQHTYMVDVGPDGRVKGWRQALGELEFSRITTGMTAQQVLLEFGPPAQDRPNGPTAGRIWSYRYPTPLCQWFQIEFNRIGRVVASSFEPDPKCASWIM